MPDGHGTLVKGPYIFTAVAIGSLLAGVLLHTVGWAVLNLLMLPLIAVTTVATLRWRRPAPIRALAASDT